MTDTQLTESLFNDRALHVRQMKMIDIQLTESPINCRAFTYVKSK